MVSFLQGQSPGGVAGLYAKSLVADTLTDVFRNMEKGAVGGMAALADKTGLSRETLYRTLSKRGNSRLDTLAVILAVFGLRLTVQPAQKSRGRRSEPRPAVA